MKQSLESQISNARAALRLARTNYIRAANALKPGNVMHKVTLRTLGYRLDSAEAKVTSLVKKFTEMKQIELMQFLGLLPS